MRVGTEEDRLYDKFLITSGLTDRLKRENIQLSQSTSAPALVTVVNGSRLISDCERDLSRVSGRRVTSLKICPRCQVGESHLLTLTIPGSAIFGRKNFDWL